MKYAAFGTHLLRGAVEIAAVKSISGPGLSLDTEDVTSHDSTEAWEEVVATILRTGEITCDLVYDPNAATHKNLAGGLLFDLTTRASTAWSIVFPTTPAVTWTFTAFVTKFEPSAPVEGGLTASVSLKITGKPTIA
ncbi:MAG: hypothetical protein A2Y53_04895 [Chloroflexi bacterium RBG_16_47_49]|nr:MAG: hypothetical protein A2Y53_04895 [Chloroflexi bacterium RBG_16_47_49]